MADPRKEGHAEAGGAAAACAPEDIDMGRMPGSEGTGNTGLRSGLQPGGTKPAGGRHMMGEIGTGGGSTGPHSDRDGHPREPEDK